MVNTLILALALTGCVVYPAELDQWLEDGAAVTDVTDSDGTEAGSEGTEPGSEDTEPGTEDSEGTGTEGTDPGSDTEDTGSGGSDPATGSDGTDPATEGSDSEASEAGSEGSDPATSSEGSDSDTGSEGSDSDTGSEGSDSDTGSAGSDPATGSEGSDSDPATDSEGSDSDTGPGSACVIGDSFGFIVDCDGFCTPGQTHGDGLCDEAFRCVALDDDDGDCTPGIPGEDCAIDDDGTSIASVRDCSGLCGDPTDRLEGICDVDYHCTALDYDDQECLSEGPGGYCPLGEGVDGLLTCFGDCAPVEALGDGVCDLEYSCDELDFDLGDCAMDVLPGFLCAFEFGVQIGAGTCDDHCVFSHLLGDGTCDPELNCPALDSDNEDCIDKDVDNDGHNAPAYGGDDCNDNNASIYPTAVEVWYDGVDQDCSGGSDFDQDGDGDESDDGNGDDCDDENPDVYSGGPMVGIGPPEISGDGLDSDCDGYPDVCTNGSPAYTFNCTGINDAPLSGTNGWQSQWQADSWATNNNQCTPVVDSTSTLSNWGEDNAARNFLVYTQSTWARFAFEADVEVTSGDDGFGFTFARSSDTRFMMFSCSNDDFIDKGNDNVATFSDNCQLFLVDGASTNATVHAESPAHSYALNTIYRYRFEVGNGPVRVFRKTGTGAFVEILSAAAPVYPAGRIGLWAYGNNDVRFDNIMVWNDADSDGAFADTDCDDYNPMVNP